MADEGNNQAKSDKFSGKYPVVVAGPYPTGDFSDDPNAPSWQPGKTEPVAEMKPAKPKKARD